MSLFWSHISHLHSEDWVSADFLPTRQAGFQGRPPLMLMSLRLWERATPVSAGDMPRRPEGHEQAQEGPRAGHRGTAEQSIEGPEQAIGGTPSRPQGGP